MATEFTIQWNHIINVGSVSKAGQTIPVVVSIGGIVRILYVYYRNPGNQ